MSLPRVPPAWGAGGKLRGLKHLKTAAPREEGRRLGWGPDLAEGPGLHSPG